MKISEEDMVESDIAYIEYQIAILYQELAEESDIIKKKLKNKKLESLENKLNMLKEKNNNNSIGGR